MSSAAPPRRPRSTARKLGLATAALLGALVLVFAVCEIAGWPFLAGPVQRQLSERLHRHVSLGGDTPRLRTHFLFSLRLDAPYLEIGAPEWSQAPHMLVARDASLRLGWLDLWRASRGETLRIRALRASSLDGNFERLADGRASWQFGETPKAQPAGQPKVPRFDRLQVDNGTLRYVDAPLAADVNARFVLRDGRAGGAAGAGAGFASSSPAVAASAASDASTPPVSASNAAGATGNNLLSVDASGRWRGFPLKIDVRSIGVLPWIADDAAAPALPIYMNAVVGRAHFNFNGTVTDALKLGGLQGRYTLDGPSLASAGEPLGVTLPTTPGFKISGLMSRQGEVWRTVVDSATIGTSRLEAAFSYDAGRAVPLLAGRLGGSSLVLADLGPAIGGGAKTADKAAAAKGASAAPSKASKKTPASSATKAGHVLPDRSFDLPSLRKMDANVLVDIASVDLGTSWLEPLKPLRGHLQLQDGVLSLTALDARTAQGSLGGSVQLDGRNNAHALWNTDLRWNDVRLERFIHQTRADGAPPYISGGLRGEAKLEGQGRSTAEILGSLRGNVRTQLRDGSLTHLGIEAAGLDIAQALGVLVQGDKALPVTCGVVDLTVDKGTLTPRVMVIDTADSAVWVDGSLSLAAETLDLRAVVTPKDFSPLTLRTPIHVRGSFSSPDVSLEKGPLIRTIGASALLALLNPLAALIPLIDMAQPDEARRDAAGCRALVQRGTASRATAPSPQGARGATR